MRVVLATRNPGKIRELSGLLGLPGLTFSSLRDHPGCSLPPEDRLTYAENALIKAEAVALWTGLPAVADDSGLEVDGLGGRPGIHSARYGGEGLTDADRVRRLLEELRGVDRAGRGARFRCALALVVPHGRKMIVEGECRGVIDDAPRGTGGFGYDPVFLLPDLGKTMAELTPEEKDRVSHRAQAARKLLPYLQPLAGP